MDADQQRVAGGEQDLVGSVAIVTGAAGGIGWATASLLATAGATVVCTDLATAVAGAAATGERPRGESMSWRPLDVSDRQAVEAVVGSVVAEHGRLDVLCNVAGILPPRRPLLELDVAELDRVLATNLCGVLHGSVAAARAMVEGGRGGAIVNLTSAAVDIPAPGLGAYAISKAGVAQLTRTLAIEVAAAGVRVNAVSPGYVASPMTAAIHRDEHGRMDEAAAARAREAADRAAPLGLATVEDVARTIVFLTSPASAPLTGQTLRPNGGVHMA